MEPGAWALDPRPKGPVQPGGGSAPARSEGDDEAMRCAACEHEITSRRHLFAHTPRGPLERYVNPGGFFHEFHTVRRAWGYRAVGEPSEAATWFAGYAWQLVVCSRCHSHLGWRYQATGGSEPESFFGLLTAAVR